jgi:hypothetical protein
LVWKGLERYLTKIYERTSFVHHVGKLFSGKRLLIYERSHRESQRLDLKPQSSFASLKNRILAAVRSGPYPSPPRPTTQGP